METSTLISLLALLFAVVFGTPTAYLAYAAMNEKRQRDHKEEIREVVLEELEPLKVQIEEIRKEVTPNHGTSMKDAMTEMRETVRELAERNGA